ncbi:MAG: helix-turn-helix domain-containing protein, partial [Phycisphaerales bacterium]|nr:helix-turn-helix domain-containing protein [Phycisphaerales bacterium]
MKEVPLSTRLREALAVRGWSQAELAVRSRLSPSFVSRLIRGEQGERISNDSLKALANALSLSVAELHGAVVLETATLSPELIQWAKSSEHVSLAVVFTDVIGSTKLNNDLGDSEWDQIRTTHFRRAEGLVGSQRGFLVKTIGDAVMVVFPNSVNAVLYAMDLERNTGDERIRIRAGVHLGVIEWNKPDFFGNTLNIAARICGKATHGGVWISDQVMHDLIADNPEWRGRWTCHANAALSGSKQKLFRLWSIPPSRGGGGGAHVAEYSVAAITAVAAAPPVRGSHHQQ